MSSGREIRSRIDDPEKRDPMGIKRMIAEIERTLNVFKRY